MADNSPLSIGFNDVPAFIRLYRKHGFANAHAVMNVRLILRDLNVRTIGDFADLFLDGNKKPKPSAMPVEFWEDCGDWSEFDEMMRSPEPMYSLGDPDEDESEESHEDDDDEGFDQEAWDRFMSEPDHPRYG